MDRREFILGGAALAGVGAFASPVRSLVGSNGEGYVESAMPTVFDYIQDGLIALWDGIENIGSGEHLDGNTPWVNLVTGETLNTGSTYFFEDNHLDMTSNVTGPTTSFNNTTFKAAWQAAVDVREYSLEIVQGLYEILPDSGSGLNNTIRVNIQPNVYGWLGTVNVSSKTPDNQSLIFNTNAGGNGNYWNHKRGYTNLLGDRSFTSVITPNGDLRVNHEGYLDGSRVEVTSIGPWPTQNIADENVSFANVRNGSWRLGRSNYNPQSVDRIYSIRVYARALTANEVAYNHQIDKARFGL